MCFCVTAPSEEEASASRRTVMSKLSAPLFT